MKYSTLLKLDRLLNGDDLQNAINDVPDIATTKTRFTIRNTYSVLLSRKNFGQRWVYVGDIYAVIRHRRKGK